MTSDEMIGKNRVEDIRWLCSLSESELDLLISVKKMAIQRSSFIEQHFLSDKEEEISTQWKNTVTVDGRL
ncbi:Spc97/Spc98 [Artemisia annua]|uniref:Spc97/Spc98 n=1 Tax=Artemisia annua TaxID=35608 RepID=A0A2U1MTV7_ARTAN|nr:Spc97/Spc98 [Artemisia annua]